MIERGRDLRGQVRLDADAVVVGTGAGGAMALRELGRAGLDVVALEEGPLLGPRDFDQREDSMLPLLFRERGGLATDDMAVRILQGRCLGGSTVHNTNLCKRTPPELLDLWARRHAVSGCSERDLAPAFDEVERDLSVSEIPDWQRNENNRILERGARALGWRGGPLRHNRVGCRHSGFCELGCAYDAKENAAKVLVPAALATGRARIWCDVRADRVETRGGAATGVRATATDGAGAPVAAVEVRARAVVLAGSAVGSAAVALASGLPDPYGRAGRGLRIHPAAPVAGFFDAPVDGVYGIPQSWECTEWLDLTEGSDRRVWILPAFAHPIGTATTMPGFGAAHMARMRTYRNLAALVAMVHDESSGQVAVGEDGAPVLRYRLGDGDRRQLGIGVRAAARLLLAAGAREVVVPSIPPVVVATDRDAAAIPDAAVGPHAAPLSAVHPMGTMCLGDDPRRAVVRSTGEHHQVRGLFVLDGSLFPTSLGVPPQISIYAFARHLARHVVDRVRAPGRGGQ